MKDKCCKNCVFITDDFFIPESSDINCFDGRGINHCWRFPKHIDVEENHYCGEHKTKDEVKDES